MNNNRRPKVACFAGGDPLDIHLWSGTPYHALQALEKQVEVVYIERNPFPKYWHILSRIIKKLSFNRIDIRMIPFLVNIASMSARRRIEECGADLYISFAASGMASKLNPDLSQILVSDATSIAIAKYYPDLQDLWWPCRAGYEAMERQAMMRAKVLTYPSQWAHDSAIEDFGVAPEKVVVAPWGPNNFRPDKVPVRTLDEGLLRLLFVGIDWKRKGGDVAIEITQALQQSGVNCHLDIIGVSSSVTKRSIPENVKFHGRLDKSDANDLKLFDKLFNSAHLFLLPTKAEALGMVFAEAAALGLPSISFATGGVETVVRHGETGLLLPPNSTAEDFANAIKDLVLSPIRYETFSHAAIEDSRNRLNWDAWSRAIREICERIN